jgi:hypothetical protein
MMCPLSSRPRAFALRAWGLPLVVVALAAAAPAAEVPKEPEPPPRLKPSRDLQISVRVRDALRQDRDLSLLRLRVNVRQGVAYLEGEVSSAEQLRAAVQRVEKVPGIFAVRAERVAVVKPRQVDDILEIPLVLDPPSQTEVKSPERPTTTFTLPTSLPRLPEPESLGPVTLLPPVPLPPLADPITPVRVRTMRIEDVISAVVERARQENPRFRALRVEVRGDSVWVRGTASQAESGMEFAQALGGLGLRHVIVQCNLPVER